MKMKLILTFIALMSTQAFAADLRDASFNSSTKVSNFAIDQGKSSINQTMKIADYTAEKMKSLLSKQMASSTRASGHVANAIVQVSEVSKPVFKLTGKGLAMVFKLSGQTGEASLDASKKLVILLDPASKATGRALEFIFDKISDGSEIASEVSTKVSEVLEPASETSSNATEFILDKLSDGTVIATEVSTKVIKPLSKGTEISSDVTEKILEVLAKVLEKPLDLTSDAIAKISELISKGSVASSKITNNIIGEDNIENGLELTGDGISLTSKGIGSVFYVITKGVTGITELFELNKEEIQKAIERNDQDTLAGLRELIRAEIDKSIEGGEVINQLLSDSDLDQYIELRLTVSAE